MSERELMRMALETGGSTRTIRRWANREKVSPFVEYACHAAASKLKIKRRRTIARRKQMKVRNR